MHRHFAKGHPIIELKINKKQKEHMIIKEKKQKKETYLVSFMSHKLTVRMIVLVAVTLRKMY